MARQQNSGAGGAIAGLVVFAFLWVITLVVLIVYINKADEATKQAANATSERAKLASDADLRKEQVLALAATEKNTAVSQLLAEVAELRKVITGTPEYGVEQIKTQVQAAADAVKAANLDAVADPHTSLIDSISKLVENYDSSQQAVAALEQQVATLQADLQVAQQENEAIAGTYNQAADGLKQQLEQDKGLAESYRKMAEAKVAELDDMLQTVRTDTAGLLADKDDEIGDLKKVINDLNSRLAKRELEGGKQAPEAWRQADGKIVSLLERSDYVYINLGQRHGLLAGTTFAVYDKALGVEASDDGLAVGKAKIEVITVNENASVARVVELERGETIQPGDLIANIVFDAKTTSKFFIFGDFDIDHDGNPGLTDKRRIEGMVLQSGGELSADLSPDVDFLVLGVEPALPEPLDPDEFDPVKIAAAEASKKRYERYYELVDRASDLSIPILNQNRFLYLVAYYRR